MLVGDLRLPLHHFLRIGSFWSASLEVDHANGDRLDNRYCNLRICTRTQNQQNRGQPRLRKCVPSSRYKGVRRSGKWAAQIGENQKKRHLGLFETEQEAASAYDRAARQIFGPFARLNFTGNNNPPKTGSLRGFSNKREKGKRESRVLSNHFRSINSKNKTLVLSGRTLLSK